MSLSMCLSMSGGFCLDFERWLAKRVFTRLSVSQSCLSDSLCDDWLSNVDLQMYISTLKAAACFRRSLKVLVPTASSEP